MTEVIPTVHIPSTSQAMDSMNTGPERVPPSNSELLAISRSFTSSRNSSVNGAEYETQESARITSEVKAGCV